VKIRLIRVPPRSISSDGRLVRVTILLLFRVLVLDPGTPR
jgi:hypothetical protein